MSRTVRFVSCRGRASFGSPSDFLAILDISFCWPYVFPDHQHWKRARARVHVHRTNDHDYCTVRQSSGLARNSLMQTSTVYLTPCAFFAPALAQGFPCAGIVSFSQPASSLFCKVSFLPETPFVSFSQPRGTISQFA